MTDSGPKTLGHLDRRGPVCESACESGPDSAPAVGAVAEPSGGNGGARSAGTAATAAQDAPSRRGKLRAEAPGVRVTSGGQGHHAADPDALAHIAESLWPLAFPVDELALAPDNARLHDAERDVPVLVESYGRFGQRKPLVGKREYRGLENVVLCGNGGLLAARHLGWSLVAVAWFEGTDDEAREYALADNATAERSRWDADALQSLAADGVDLATWWGDDKPALDALLDLPVSEADWSHAFAALPTDEPTFEQKTFTLTHAQAALVERALAVAKRPGAFADTGNQNSNGNALARIAEAFVAANEGASS
jgi:hypothetical protein